MTSSHKLSELAFVLRELEGHLRTHGEPDWARQLSRCAEAAERSDYDGAGQFLGLCAGMGSLNDLVLHRNGRWLPTETNELQALLGRATRTANELRGEQR